MTRRLNPDQTPGETGTTQDLAAKYAARAAVPPPQKRPWYESASAEEHVRTRGRWLVIVGVTTGALTFAIEVIWRKGFQDDMPIGYLLPLYVLAFGAITAGCTEYLGRPNRYTADLCLHRINELDRQVDALVGLLGEELRQQYYRGYVGGHADQRRTGTENVRPFEREPGEVVQFRAGKRNDSFN